MGAFRGLGVNNNVPGPVDAGSSSNSATAAYADLSPLVGSYGARLPGRSVTLATSFRDPHHIPLQALGEASGVGELDENSDEEWSNRKARGVGARKAGGEGEDEEGVFGCLE